MKNCGNCGNFAVWFVNKEPMNCTCKIGEFTKLKWEDYKKIENCCCSKYKFTTKKR